MLCISLVVGASELFYACDAWNIKLGADSDFIKESKTQSYEKHPAGFIAAFIFTDYLSSQQYDRTAVKYGDDYPARDCAAHFSCSFRLNVSRVYLAWKR